MIVEGAGAIAEAAARLAAHDEAGVVKGPPGHPFFGAGFLLIGSVLLIETLAGPVWGRVAWRRMLWPAALFVGGLGMLVVVYVQPTEKALHLILALLLLLGGWFEARYRLGHISRASADAFAIPALIVGGFVIGPMHAQGNTTLALTHSLVGVVGWALAAIKLAEVRYGEALSLQYGFAVGVMALGMSLLFIEQFHPGAH